MNIPMLLSTYKFNLNINVNIILIKTITIVMIINQWLMNICSRVSIGKYLIRRNRAFDEILPT